MDQFFKYETLKIQVLSVPPCVAWRQIPFIFDGIIQSESYRAEYGVF